MTHHGDRRQRACSGVQQSLRWLISTPYATQFSWFRDFSGEWFPSSLRTPQIRVRLISVKLLISPISRHAAKRLDLTGQTRTSTETTDLQAKLWFGNVPRFGADCWTGELLATRWHQERDCKNFHAPCWPAHLLMLLHLNPTFTFSNSPPDVGGLYNGLS